MKKRFLCIFLILCSLSFLFSSQHLTQVVDTDASINSRVQTVCSNHTMHNENCGYVAAREAQPCSHLLDQGNYSCAPVPKYMTASGTKNQYVCTHSDQCGYTEAAEGAACNHQCALCKGDTTITPLLATE